MEGGGTFPLNKIDQPLKSTLSGQKGTETGVDGRVGGRAGEPGRRQRHGRGRGRGQHDHPERGGAVRRNWNWTVYVLMLMVVMGGLSHMTHATETVHDCWPNVVNYQCMKPTSSRIYQAGGSYNLSEGYPEFRVHILQMWYDRPHIFIEKDMPERRMLKGDGVREIQEEVLKDTVVRLQVTVGGLLRQVDAGRPSTVSPGFRCLGSVSATSPTAWDRERRSKVISRLNGGPAQCSSGGLTCVTERHCVRQPVRQRRSLLYICIQVSLQIRCYTRRGCLRGIRRGGLERRARWSSRRRSSHEIDSN